MWKWLAYILGSLVILGLIGLGGVAYMFFHYSQDLPEHAQLKEYSPKTVTRVHAGDGRLLDEFAVEKRVFVPIDATPGRIQHAFIAAEDQRFYEHDGVDVIGIVRAALTNAANIGSDRKLVGASTITQQVAKNFLLTNEVSIERKVREAILAWRIDEALSKDEILELYLNEIYLGGGSYGVTAAALNYFNKSLDELTIGEAAFLGGLPKAPNNYHPVRNPEAALSRRDYVIGRMLEDGYITDAEADAAMAETIDLQERDEAEAVTAQFFSEEVRRQLITRYGEDALYGGGLSVRTTLDPHLQRIADKALHDGILAYDRRHGWRGPVTRLPAMDDWRIQLEEMAHPDGGEMWRLATVLDVQPGKVDIGLIDARGEIPLAEMKWAREWIDQETIGPPVESAAQVLEIGDVILVEPVAKNGEGGDYPENTYALRQLPDVNGAVVALDPHTGRVLAVSGGWSFARSEFNRATQARRQPGSAFKPFVYITALEEGFTPSSIILDAPFVIDQGGDLGKWKPTNYSGNYYGPSTMRLGIEKSRNLMTVRLAQQVGMEHISDMAGRFGVVDNMQPTLAMALGSAETTLIRMTAGYAMMVNGGKRIEPTFIDRIQDRNGETVFRHDERPCPECRVDLWLEQAPPELPDNREQIVDPVNAYQMVSMLQGVVQRGTGARIAELGRPLAGKTGTTNDSFDAWFVGFSPDLALGVYMGFDEPRSLGRQTPGRSQEQGASVAVPVWKDFMEAALQDAPKTPFRIPSGVTLIRVDKDTGQAAAPGDPNAILEAFMPGSGPPPNDAAVIGGTGGPGAQQPGDPRGTTPVSGTGGIY